MILSSLLYVVKTMVIMTLCVCVCVCVCVYVCMYVCMYVCTFSEILAVIFLVLRRWKSYGASFNEYSDAMFMVLNVPQKELCMTGQCCHAVVTCSFSLDML